MYVDIVISNAFNLNKKNVISFFSPSSAPDEPVKSMRIFTHLAVLQVNPLRA